MSNNIATKLEVARAMETYGGSFVQKLGAALVCADPTNTQIIKDGWSELWDAYAEKAKEDKDT